MTKPVEVTTQTPQADPITQAVGVDRLVTFEGMRRALIANGTRDVPLDGPLPAWTKRYQAVRRLCAQDAAFRVKVMRAVSLNERSRLINQAKRATLPSDQFISVRCESCDAAMTFVVTPAADDDAGWARISEEHLLTCQYVATRGVTPQEEATA